MARVKLVLRLLVLAFFALFLHYVLPQHDIVKVTSTEVIRTDFSSFNRIFFAQSDSGAVSPDTRDLRLINTQKQSTYLLGFIKRDTSRVMVYRNEDTGWIWPPYFKFNSADLQAVAANLARGDEWVVVTHYGWRNRWLSTYPNAVKMRTIAGPDVTIIPWFNIGFFIFLLIAMLFVRAMWRQFWERAVDPVLDSAGHRMDEAQAGIAERRSRLSRWFGRK
ncbi:MULTISPECIES: DUF1523 family protein [unclassified Yoonia]|uniref:DUF1523 family protein n=1 Tax=unclassified Yoonia TaxID=2629118 RepID=UPI002AFFE9F9|nr:MULTISPECIES: DUF1523 family protein [unclassified Yoonia]